nr:hypothetical protein [Tanacetum cinerariifolium]
AMAPKSVHTRKNTFLRTMGLSYDGDGVFEDNAVDDGVLKQGVEDRITQTSGAVLRVVDEEEEEDDSLVCSTSNSCSERTQDSNGEEDGGKFSETVSGPLVQKLVDRM